MSKTVSIKDRRVLPSMSPERRGKNDVVILYEVETVGQYSLVIPEETATPEGIQAAIRDQVKARDTLRSQEFTVD